MILTLIALVIGAPVLWTVAKLLGALAWMGVLCVMIGVSRVFMVLLDALHRRLPQVAVPAPD